MKFIVYPKQNLSNHEILLKNENKRLCINPVKTKKKKKKYIDDNTGL